MNKQKLEYRKVEIVVPAEFDSAGFAEYLDMCEEEFWKDCVKTSIQASLSAEDYQILEWLKQKFGLTRVIDWW